MIGAASRAYDEACAVFGWDFDLHAAGAIYEGIVIDRHHNIAGGAGCGFGAHVVNQSLTDRQIGEVGKA